MEGVCFTPILEEKLSQVRNFKMKMLLTTPEAKQAREAAFAENKGLGTRSTKTRGARAVGPCPSARTWSPTHLLHLQLSDPGAQHFVEASNDDPLAAGAASYDHGSPVKSPTWWFLNATVLRFGLIFIRP